LAIDAFATLAAALALTNAYLWRKPMDKTINRLRREALAVLSYSVPSTKSYRALCRRFLAQHPVAS